MIHSGRVNQSQPGDDARSRAASPSMVGLFGAPLDTHNLGVSALGSAVLATVAEHDPSTRLSVFDNGYGTGTDRRTIGDHEIEWSRFGVRHSKRLWRDDTLVTSLAKGLVRLPGTTHRAVRSCDAVFDVSGGDSFSDIYGLERFSAIALHKAFALSQRRPLVLLPQTYGPFTSPRVRRVAAALVRRASIAYARDEWSFERLQDLLGTDFDPDRHRLAVDLAFALPRSEHELDPELTTWIGAGHPVAGLNVNGMLFNDADSAGRFGLAGDHRELCEQLVRRLVERGASVLLVPHNTSPAGLEQSDAGAGEALAAMVADLGDAVRVAPTVRDASSVKGLIGRLDWFTGARMHATIAGLSTGVPTAAMAYSPKAAGVFASAGRADHVVELRNTPNTDAIEALVASFDARDEGRAALQARAAELRDEAQAPVLAGLGLAMRAS